MSNSAMRPVIVGAGLLALAHLAAPLVPAAHAQSPVEANPVVTLEDAIARAMRADPSMVTAHGQLTSASWARRAARATLALPSVDVSSNLTGFSAPAFNIGTLQPATRIVTSQVQASYDIHLGGRQFAQLRQAGTLVTRAEAAETQTRFALRRAVTADYWAVVSARELQLVAEERLRRAEEQLAVTRSRVRLGAVVASDSLQLALEVSRARIEVLERSAASRVSRLQLGRRLGMKALVDAAPTDTSVPAALPMPEQEAIAQAVRSGPAFVAARADESAAAAAFHAERSAYLPKITIAAAAGGFDDRFFPRAAYRSQLSVAVSLPVWDNGARELAVVQARAARDASTARRRDLELGAAQSVAAAHASYTTARAGIDLAGTGVAVARETYRVQDARYRAGATTVLDVLEAQGALTRAESDLVLARQRARLALADLEAILGQRLSADTP